jgi:predicted metal-dependent hydrolase
MGQWSHGAISYKKRLIAMVSWTILLAYIVEKMQMAIVSQDKKKKKKKKGKKERKKENKADLLQ